jgi:hypothetical protein
VTIFGREGCRRDSVPALDKPKSIPSPLRSKARSREAGFPSTGKSGFSAFGLRGRDRRIPAEMLCCERGLPRTRMLPCQAFRGMIPAARGMCAYLQHAGARASFRTDEKSAPRRRCSQPPHGGVPGLRQVTASTARFPLQYLRNRILCRPYRDLVQEQKSSHPGVESLRWALCCLSWYSGSILATAG